ncbi:hypothetical protein BDV30DRAFT_233656 [Aspergillus minisclerotigenes]|uniref:Uncharacterized protein n=1 Tax=Aspergillus minisclerotigenes TaxID=656917 RepID=A0A5N6JII7_9EURO|nr:hypothetical protein BDV30DRAFT_233656 [Aspergillus minisclerotigenes]
MAHGPEGTIYRDEEGFDDILKIDINFTQMKIIKELKKSETSSIFHVNYNDEPRVFKVFHNNEDAGYADDGPAGHLTSKLFSMTVVSQALF